ncbi:WD repeat-containing protein 87, partial [Gonapodya sp. JEL0774]
MIFTCGRDSLIRGWKVLPNLGAPRPSDGFKVPFLVEHAFTTALPGGDPVQMAVAQNMGVIFVGFASGISITVPYDPASGFGPPYKHSRDDDHSGRVTSVALVENLNLFATASVDGTVKVWTRECALVREVQFNEPVSAVEFLNSRGDLVVGLEDGVNIVKCQDYLPRHILLAILKQSHEDDPVEALPVFEPGPDFVNYYQSGYKDKSESHRSHAGAKIERIVRRRERALDEVIKRKLADIEKQRDDRVQQIYELIESYKLFDTEVDASGRRKSRYEESLFMFAPNNGDQPREAFQYKTHVAGMGEWINYTEEELIEKAREYRRMLKKKLARRGTILSLGFVPDLVHDGTFMEQMMKLERTSRRKSTFPMDVSAQLNADLLTEEELTRLIQKHDPNMDTEDRRRLLTQLHRMAAEEESRIARQKKLAAERAEKAAVAKAAKISSNADSQPESKAAVDATRKPQHANDGESENRDHKKGKRRHGGKHREKGHHLKSKMSRKLSGLGTYEISGSSDAVSLSNPSLKTDNFTIGMEMKRKIEIARKLRMKVESKFQAMGVALPNSMATAAALRGSSTAAAAKQKASTRAARKSLSVPNEKSADSAASSKLKDLLSKRRQQRREQTPQTVERIHSNELTKLDI